MDNSRLPQHVGESKAKTFGIKRTWKNDTIDFEVQHDDLYKDLPRHGMVIGTYAAVPYIHLQLEARRRYYPHVPCLIHDDASDHTNTLYNLCKSYGVDFEYNEIRMAPCVGDLSAFYGGLKWAKDMDLDILLKVSRRWLFLTNWTESLSTLAVNSQYATFCSYTTSFDFGFRTECLAMSVKQWHSEEVLSSLFHHIKRQDSVFVEGYMHNFARQFELMNSAKAKLWNECNPMPPDRSGYALWELMGIDRCSPSGNYLWHDCSSADDYFNLSKTWGLPYYHEDFVDPNQGAGDRPLQVHHD